MFESVTRLMFRQPAPATSESSAARPSARLRIGLALGSGAARGFAHIGVLQALTAAGIVPDIVAGTSIGAVVGGCFAAGRLAELEQFALDLTKRRILAHVDLTLGRSGLIAGERLARQLAFHFGETLIEDLPFPFLAIATEISTGHEIWLSSGRLVDALRASYALPGLFEPVRVGGRWLVDGALVNPVPVSACRALGAEFVIAVGPCCELTGRGTVVHALPAEPHPSGREADGRPSRAPRLSSVMVDAFSIIQDRVTRARLAGDPPDATISLKLGRIGFFEFHRAAEAIAMGRECGARAAEDIRAQIAAELEPARSAAQAVRM